MFLSMVNLVHKYIFKPTYLQDFSDFIIRPLDTKDSKFDAASKSVKSKDMEVLTDTDMIFVSDIHQLLFTTYTTTAWYKCAGAQSVPLTSYNHEETVIQNYQLSSDLASHTSHLFGKEKVVNYIDLYHYFT